MPDTVRTLRVELLGQTSKFEQAFRNASKITGDFGKATAGLSKNLASIGGQMEKAGRALTVGISGPLVALGGLASKLSIDFESAFAGVRKTLDATPEQFDALSQGFRDLSKEIPVTATELAKIGEIAGQLGIAPDNVLAFTKVIADLGETTNLSTEEAATSLARLANITGLPQDSFDRLGSTIVDLGNNFATNEAEITDFGLRIAGAGKLAGLAESDILAIGAAFSSIGVEAEAGGTSVQKVLNAMTEAVATNNADLQVFAATAGQTAEQFAASFRENAAGAFRDFVEGLGQSGEGAFQILEGLGLENERVIRAFLGLANAGDLLRDTIDTASTAWEQNTALTEKAGRRYETTASRLTVLKNQFVDLGVRIGDALRPAIDALIVAGTRAAEVIDGLVTKFLELPEPVKVAAGFTAIAAAISGPLIFALGSLATNLSAVIKLMSTLSGTQAATGLTAIVSQAGALTGALGNLGNSIPILTARVALMETGLGTAATASGLLSGAAVAAGAAIGVGLGTAIARTGAEASIFADHIVEGTEKVGLLEGAVSVLPDVLSALWEGLKNIGAALLDVGRFVVDWITNTTAWRTAIQVLEAAFGPLIDVLKAVGTFVVDLGAKISDFARSISGDIVVAFDRLAEKVYPVTRSAQELSAEARDLAEASKIAGREVTDWGEAQRLIGERNREAIDAAQKLAAATRDSGAATDEARTKEEARLAAVLRAQDALKKKEEAEKAAAKAAKEAAEAAERFRQAVETETRGLLGGFDPNEVKVFATALESLGGAGDVVAAQLEPVAMRILEMKAAGEELPPIADEIVNRWIALNNATAEVDRMNRALAEERAVLERLGPTVADVSKEFDQLVRVAEKVGIDALSDQQLAAYVAEMERLADAGELTTDQFLKLGAAYDEQIRRGAIPQTVEATRVTIDWSASLQDISNIMQGMPGILGDIGSAIGSVTIGINGMLAGFAKFGEARGVGGLGGLLGQITGIGTAITSVIGIASSIGGLISGAFRKEEEEVNDLRDEFFSQWSDGFVGLQRELAGTIGAVENQDFVKQIFDAKTVEEFNAAVAKTRGLLGTQTEAQNELNAALEKYGFSDQVAQAQELADEGAQLYKEFRLLTEGGLVPAGEALTAMGSNLSDFVNKSIAAGQAIPEAMRPMIEAAIQNGTLLDENGNAYESVEAAGISFAQTMSEQFQTLIDKLDEWLSALSGAKPSPINVPVNYQTSGEPPPGIPNIPKVPGIPELAEGGILQRAQLVLAGEAGPEAFLPLDRFLQMLGPDQGGSPARVEVTNIVNAPLNPLQTHETVRQTTDYLVGEVQRALGANIADLVARGEA